LIKKRGSPPFSTRARAAICRFCSKKNPVNCRSPSSTEPCSRAKALERVRERIVSTAAVRRLTLKVVVLGVEAEVPGNHPGHEETDGPQGHEEYSRNDKNQLRPYGKAYGSFMFRVHSNHNFGKTESTPTQ
jgi:hypothetical protein